MSSDSEIYSLSKRVRDLEYKVDYLLKKLNVEYIPPAEAPIDPRLSEKIMKGDMIGAIKIYRQLYEVDLADAKRDVEALAARMRGK